MTAPTADPRAALSEDARAKQRRYYVHFQRCQRCQNGWFCGTGERINDMANYAYGRLERRVGRCES